MQIMFEWKDIVVKRSIGHIVVILQTAVSSEIQVNVNSPLTMQLNLIMELKVLCVEG